MLKLWGLGILTREGKYLRLQYDNGIISLVTITCDIKKSKQ
jgi:hypothetical protein